MNENESVQKDSTQGASADERLTPDASKQDGSAQGVSANDQPTPDASKQEELAQPDAAGEGVRQIDFEEVKRYLYGVNDPEINLSVVELGLIYGHEWDPQTHKLKIIMTLTSQMCPLGPEIVHGVQIAAQQIPDVREVEVELVWNPPWDPRTHCSEDAKAMLGIWD